MLVVSEFGWLPGCGQSSHGFRPCVVLAFEPDEADQLVENEVRLHALKGLVIELSQELGLVYRSNGLWYPTPLTCELFHRPVEEVKGKLATWLYAFYRDEGFLEQVEDYTGEQLH